MKNKNGVKKFVGLFTVLLTFTASDFIPGNRLQAQIIPYQYVRAQNRQLLVDFDQDGSYRPYLIKGAGYSPTPIGRYNGDWGYSGAGDPRPDNFFDDPAILNRDFASLQAMNVNTLRLWKGNNTQVTLADAQNPSSLWYQRWNDIGRFTNYMTTQTLDVADQYGLKVIAGFEMPWPGEFSCPDGATQSQYARWVDYTNPVTRDDLLSRFEAYVRQFKDHPAILFWAIGNENNYGFDNRTAEGLAQIQAFYSLVRELGQRARQVEGSYYHPVAVVNGDLGYIGQMQYGTTDTALPEIDIWGVNVYRSGSFGNLFADFQALSQKGLWISEYGVDAWHTTNIASPQNGYEDQSTQSTLGGQLWDETAAAFRNGQAMGGTIMEYSDEWWKPYEWLCEIDEDPNTTANGSGGCNLTHNFYGHGPRDESCPRDGTTDWTPGSPDSFLNEEWWGVMAISPNPVLYQPDVMSSRQIYGTLQQKFADQAPNLASINAQTIAEGAVLNVEISASDPELDPITLTARLTNGNEVSAIGATFTDRFDGTGIFSWQPTYVQSGNYDIIVRASDGLKWNEQTISVIVTDKLVADLTLTSISSTSPAVSPGSAVSAPHNVANTGTAPAGAFTINFHLSADAVYGGTNDVAFTQARTVTGLNVGANSSATMALTIPVTTSLRNYYICAQADTGAAVTEQDETNNSRCTADQVNVAWGDLVMAPASGPASVARGTSVTVNTTVSNLGQGYLSGFYVGIYLSSDPVITTTDWRVGRRYVGGLSAGGNSAAAAIVTIPAAITPRTYYWGVIADYTATRPEGNEINNARAGNVLVVR